jgi:hypothetical protein
MSCLLKERVKGGATIYVASFTGVSSGALLHALEAVIRPLTAVRAPNGRGRLQHEATLRMPKVEVDALVCEFLAAYAVADEAKAAAASALPKRRMDEAEAALREAEEEKEALPFPGGPTAHAAAPFKPLTISGVTITRRPDGPRLGYLARVGGWADGGRKAIGRLIGRGGRQINELRAASSGCHISIDEKLGIVTIEAVDIEDATRGVEVVTAFRDSAGAFLTKSPCRGDIPLAGTGFGPVIELKGKVKHDLQAQFKVRIVCKTAGSPPTVTVLGTAQPAVDSACASICLRLLDGAREKAPQLLSIWRRCGVSYLADEPLPRALPPAPAFAPALAPAAALAAEAEPAPAAEAKPAPAIEPKPATKPAPAVISKRTQWLKTAI